MVPGSPEVPVRLPIQLVAVLIVVTACGTPPPPEEKGPHFLFSADPMSLDNPFPDARLVVSDQFPATARLPVSGVLLRPDYFQPFLHEKAKTKQMTGMLKNYATMAAELDGVGTFGATLLRVSDTVDVTSVRGKVTRLVWRGDKYEVLEQDVAVEHSFESLAEGQTPDGVPEYLMVVPKVRMPAGAHGLLVVKRGVKTREGAEYVQGAEFSVMPESKGWREGSAAALGISEDEVLVTIPQTAGESRSVYTGLAKWTAEAQVPTFQIPAKAMLQDAAGERPVGVWKASDSDWGQVQVHLKRKSFSGEAASVGQVVIGTIASRELRNEKGVWSQEWIADPSLAPSSELIFTLTLPAGDKPEGGWPVVIGGHGVSGRNSLLKNNGESYCVTWAEILAQRGLGCIGIDAAEHGHRGDPINNFFTMRDLLKIRERFRQTVFDLMQLSRTAQVLDVDGDGTADLSPELGYFGHSLGGIIGSAFVSQDARIRYSVLAAPGGGLSNVLMSPDIKGKLGFLLAGETAMSFGSVEFESSFPLIRTLGQLFLEAGDPVNLAGIEPDRAAMVLEELQDWTVPNNSTRDLVTALGFPKVEQAVTGTEPLQLHFVADPADYLPADRLPTYNAHDLIFERNAGPLRNLIQNFLESRGRTVSLD